MKRVISSVAALLLILLLPMQAEAARLVPVGELIGLHLRTEAVTVAAFDEVLGTGARDAGLKIGDRLLEIDGQRISRASDVSTILGTGQQTRITLIRGSKKIMLDVPVRQTESGPKLGIYLRQGISGVGTVSWYDPETGRFGALGHGVSGSDGVILAMVDGEVYDVRVGSIRRGKAGEPGQLSAEAGPETLRGSLYKNSPQGVFGKTDRPWTGEVLETAEYDRITAGPATIRCTVRTGQTRDYSVEIVKIYPQDRSDGRNFLLRITDPALLRTTGGIIQGMSGSPIIQDGKLIGAVTHVLVNQPDTGYGIFIENMLDAAEGGD